MLFRIAFYLCKAGLVGGVLAVVGACLAPLAADWAVWLWGPGLALAVTGWLAWSLLTGVQNTGGRLWCPLCGTRCPMHVESLFGLRPTLACPRCGLVRGDVFTTRLALAVDCPDDPTRDWQKQPDLALRFDFDRNTLNGVALGGPLARLSPLGPVEDKVDLIGGQYSYPSLGVAVLSDGETIASFTLTWGAAFAAPGGRPFAGQCAFGGREVRLGPDTTEAQFVEVFGPPYWRDDEGYVSLFYVFPGAAWEVSFSDDGTLGRIDVSRESVLARAEYRKFKGVTKPWPFPEAAAPVLEKLP